MKQFQPGIRGFTLVELMIVVGIVGILGTIAIPQFQRYMWQSKQSEAFAMINAMYKGAAAYYEGEFVSQGLGGTQLSHCLPKTVDRVEPCTGNAILLADKTVGDFTTDPTWAALNVQSSGPMYHGFYWGSTSLNDPTAVCGIETDPWAAYATAGADYDDDPSTGIGYWLAIAAISGRLVRAPAISVSENFPQTLDCDLNPL